MHELVKDYYGKQLAGTADLRTSACCDASAVPDAQTQLFRLLCGLDAPIRMLVEEHDSLETVFLRATDEGTKVPS